MPESPATAPKPFCFVLMPFSKEFDDVYQIGIQEACDKAGAYCERVDEQDYDGSILDRIYNQISKADFIIADMTGQNANVFYEVGYAHALGKRTILLTKNSKDIPFDLTHHPHIVYKDSLTILRDELTSRVEWSVQNPIDDDENTTIDIELFLGDKPLAAGDVALEYPQKSAPKIRLVIHNRSSATFEPGSFQIGIITGRFFYSSGTVASSSPDVISIPSGGYIHMLSHFPVLFPQSYADCLIYLVGDRNITTPDPDQKITCRVFTPMGTRDFPLTLRAVEVEPS